MNAHVITAFVRYKHTYICASSTMHLYDDISDNHSGREQNWRTDIFHLVVILPSFMLSFGIFIFCLLLSFALSNILMREMDDYVDLAMNIFNNSSNGKFIDFFFWFKEILFIWNERRLHFRLTICMLLLDHIFTLILVRIDSGMHTFICNRCDWDSFKEVRLLISENLIRINLFHLIHIFEENNTVKYEKNMLITSVKLFYLKCQTISKKNLLFYQRNFSYEKTMVGFEIFLSLKSSEKSGIVL